MSRRGFLGLSAAILGVLGVFTADGYLNTERIQLTRLNFDIGGKAVFVVDTHLHGVKKVHEEILGIIAGEDPDAVLLGGDLVDEYTHNLEVLSVFLSGLDSNWKIAVLGNHEYWSGKASEVALLLRRHGFVVLFDTYIDTSFGRVYGLDWRDDRKYPPLAADNIVLVHDPNAASSVSGRCLVLAGHTHGGVVIGGLTLFSNSLYSRGSYVLQGGGRLYVSRGLGQIFPIRFTSPLELLIIE